jgi:Zn-finger nucleic acid-binding protein
MASLNCPNCGAASAADAARCDYCGSALATASCPSCFSPIFVGAQYCTHCGARSTRELIDGAPQLHCPGCDAIMLAVRVGVTPLHECPECASTWLASDVFTNLCSSRDERGMVASSVGALIPHEKPSQAAVRYVPCPECKKVMNRSNFGQRSGIIIDVCRNHGVWLEHDELRRVLTFVDSGGLQRARELEREQAAAERQLAELMRGAPTATVTRSVTSIHITSDDANTSLLHELLRGLFS